MQGFCKILISPVAWLRGTVFSCKAFGFLLYGLVAFSANAQDLFENVTQGSGVEYSGESYGAAWGDLNRDLYPDLFLSNHRNAPSLFVNNGDGTFTDIAQDVELFAEWPHVDAHGSAWGDFDNDGDQDLYATTGGANSNQFLLNQDGQLVDRTAQFDPGIPRWRGRQPIWLDYDLDGLLDFWMASSQSDSDIFQQDPSGQNFVNRTDEVGIQCDDGRKGYLADFSGDDRLELICANTVFPLQSYETTFVPFTLRTDTIPSRSLVLDTAIGDFDGDLDMDFLNVHGRQRISGIAQITQREVQAHLNVSGAREETLRFVGDGTIDINIDWDGEPNIRNLAAQVFIGADGANPSSFTSDNNENVQFVLSADDSTNWGIQPHDPASDQGVYIGFDVNTNEWVFQLSAGGRFSQTYIKVISSVDISDVSSAGFQTIELPRVPTLFFNTPSGFQNVAQQNGFDEEISCNSAVTADFDNDMDLDIYVACRGGISNIANRFYENNGQGVFSFIPGAHGAEGVVGIGLEVGTSESVIVADYDNNGFLDLFVTNGNNLVPEGDGGPSELFRNNGNNNNWIEIDLEGVVSNRDGVGATVYATTNGITQVREQNGGYHRWSQNFKRIHFGLAENSFVDIEVHWPNGDRETISDIQANGIYRITEGSGVAARLDGVMASVVSLDGDISLDEDAGVATVQLSMTPAQTELVTVELSTVNDSAVSPEDFTEQTSTLVSFAAGETTASVDIAIVDDAEVESTESFNVNIANVTGNAVLSTTAATVSITDNDVVAASDVSLVGDVGVAEDAGIATVQLSLSPASDEEVTVELSTVDGSAVSPEDFMQQTSTLVSFAIGETTASVNIAIVDDAEVESTESFNVNIANVTGNAVLGTTAATVSISDNDAVAASEVSLAGDVVVAEDAGVATVQLSMTPAQTELVTVELSTADGSAVSPDDFTGRAGTLVSFPVGETTASVDVAIVDDAEVESTEDFAISIANVVGNAQLGTTAATVSISDNDVSISPYGRPRINRDVDRALFVWRNGNNDDWQVVASAGGVTDQTAFTGAVITDQGFTNVKLVNIEPSDTIDFTSNPNVLAYDMNVATGNGPIDQFRFGVPSGSSSCFMVTDAPSGQTVLIGESRTPIVAPFDLSTLQPCTDIPVTVTLLGDISVSEAAGVVSVPLSLTRASTELITIDIFTSDGSASTASDYDGLLTPLTVSFLPGETSTSIDIPILEDSVFEGSESFTVNLINVSGDAVIGSETVTVTIEDNEFSPFGRPDIDRDVDQGLFVWQNELSGVWHVIASAGGDTQVSTFAGSIYSSPGFTQITPINIERNDSLDDLKIQGKLFFELNVASGLGPIDEFSFEFPIGSSACLTADQLPSGQTIFVGEARTPLTTPLDLATLGPCTNLPTIVSLGEDLIVSEADGTASIAINLSSPGAELVTVELTTEDGTAVNPDDYLGVTLPLTISFQPGETSVSIDIPITDDQIAEISSETFTVNIDNASSNALIEDAVMVVSIQDNEPSIFGRPAIDRDTDQALFLWQDLVTGEWNVVASAGGVTQRMSFAGVVESDLGFSQVMPVNIENSDLLDNTSNLNELIFNLSVATNGGPIDEFKFSTPAGASTCFNVNDAPSGNVVLLGEGRVPLLAPFDLTTFQSCESPNIVPVANGQALTTEFETAVLGTLTGSDGDSGPQALSFTEAGVAVGGNVVIDGAMGAFTFTPALGFSGAASFEFTVSDGSDTSVAALVTIEVSQRPNVVPVANGQALTTEFETAVLGTLTGSDGDSGPQALSFTEAGVAVGGNVVIDGAMGAFTFTPALGFSGAASFEFTVSDGSDTSVAALVTIEVAQRPNAVPVANSLTISAASETDVVGTLTGVDPDNAPLPLNYQESGSAVGGSVIIDNNTGEFVFSPSTGFSGPARFGFTVYDGLSQSAVAWVNIDVANAIPIANSQTLSTEFGTTLTGTLSATDANGDDLTFIVTNGIGGTVSVDQADTSVFTFVPTLGFSGQASFSFIAFDGQDASASTTVSIDVGSQPLVVTGLTTNITLNESFESSLFNYTSNVGFLNDNVVLSADFSNGTLEINGIAVDSGESISDNLEVGENSFSFVLNNGSAQSIYNLVVTRAPASNIAQSAFLKASNAGGADRFGTALSASGSTLVVGAFREDGDGSLGGAFNGFNNNSGAAYVYSRDSGGSWLEQALLRASNLDVGDQFGSSVAMSGDTIVVGAPFEDSNPALGNANNSLTDSGAVYVYVKDGNGNWIEQALLKASNAGSGDRFGNSVAIYGDILAVGASFEDSIAGDSGAVYVFTRDVNGLWSQQQLLKAANTNSNDLFGGSISISEDRLVVGAVFEDSVFPNSGAAYVFERDSAGNWFQQAFLKASNAGSGDEFGTSVSLSGDRLVVGAVNEDSGRNANGANNILRESGAAYVFARTSSGSWQQEALLKASNGDSRDEFGTAVSISGSNVVVGAALENSASSLTPSDNSLASSGAAYLYSFDANSSWVEQAIFKAENADVGDEFGTSVVISGNSVIVSAVREDSNPSIGPASNDDLFSGSGAVYLFSNSP